MVLKLFYGNCLVRWSSYIRWSHDFRSDKKGEREPRGWAAEQCLHQSHIDLAEYVCRSLMGWLGTELGVWRSRENTRERKLNGTWDLGRGLDDWDHTHTWVNTRNSSNAVELSHVRMLAFLCNVTGNSEPFLRSRQLCSYWSTSQHFMEPEGLLSCSQEPSTGLYLS
jgi:hypothetical protein